MAVKNPRRHLRQNRPKSYFAINGKIDTTLVESAQVFLCQMKVFYHRNFLFLIKIIPDLEFHPLNVWANF